MTRPARLVVLCEDRQQFSFIRRFLVKRGWTGRDIEPRIHFPAKGSGEQGVRKQFPGELRAYRSKCNHLRNGLLVAVDADKQEVAERVRGLDLACDEQNVPRRGADERVLLVVPKRNIETWLAYLRGESVNEADEYAGYPHEESRCHPQGDRLSEMCRVNKLDGTPPPSLERCCTDFQAFWCLIQP